MNRSVFVHFLLVLFFDSPALLVYTLSWLCLRDTIYFGQKRQIINQFIWRRAKILSYSFKEIYHAVSTLNMLIMIVENCFGHLKILSQWHMTSLLLRMAQNHSSLKHFTFSRLDQTFLSVGFFSLFQTWHLSSRHWMRLQLLTPRSPPMSQKSYSSTKPGTLTELSLTSLPILFECPTTLVIMLLGQVWSIFIR